MQRSGVFIIHGTFGSPHEYAPLEDSLRSNGIGTCAISLPGHGDSPEKMLHEISGDEILAHCLDSFHTFARNHDEVMLLGHSLGGMCALITAGQSQTDNLCGVISMASPYEHAYFVNNPLGLLNLPMTHLLPGLRYAPQGYTGFKTPAFMPWWFPKLYQEAHQILNCLQQTLPQIEVPVFLAHSPYDLIVPYSEMEKIAARIGKPDKIHQLTLNNCGHQIYPVSEATELMTHQILGFLGQYMSVSVPLTAIPTQATV